jgi:hypothetical protein|tara:strand:+ start:4055 stop:4531 length:477 start_codon:yes stop_codon:yes gene_type:complete
MSIKAGNTYGNSITYPRPGIGSVGSYQVAGAPYVTGTLPGGGGQLADTELQVAFPFVTRRITVLNLSSNATIFVHFNSHDPAVAGGSTGAITGSHYIPLDSNEDSITMNIKCNELYVTTPPDNAAAATWRVFAELTHIGGGQMYQLTGSGATDGPDDP